MPRSRETRTDLFMYLAKHNLSRATEILGFAAGWLLLDCEDFFTLIVPAMWTNMMGKAHLMAIGTRNQIPGRHREMAATAVTATFG